MAQLPLKNNANIAIVGSGPAGSSCAIRLLQQAKKRGININVTMYEGKDFQVHHNQCVGVLSPPLIEILSEELDIELPPNLFKRTIYAYMLHYDESEILLVDKGDAGLTITVRRLEFDRFLLETAQKLGATLIRSRVNYIEFMTPEEEAGSVRIYCDSGYLKADCMVAAFGLDSMMLTVLEDATRGARQYHRPKKVLKTYITKIHSSPVVMRQKIGNIIYAYVKPREIPRIEFGAISPKGDHVIINIAGEKVTSLDMDMFLSLEEVREHLPDINYGELNYFEGSFPTAPSQNPYGDRYVAVGDTTGWMRPFKGKGINVAVTTGIRAADAIINYGVGKDSFDKYELSCKDLLDDYIYGAMVRTICNKASGLFMSYLMNVALVNPIIYDALFDSVSGQRAYKDIMKSILRPEFVKKSASIILKKYIKRGRKMHEIIIRNLSRADIDAIRKIDERITGKPQEAYWTGKITKYLSSEPGACFVAEVDNKLVGFILGDIRGWEYMSPISGWLDIIGVDIDYRSMGIGKKLIDALFDYFKKAGIEEIITMVSWNDVDLVEYFRSTGFERGQYINMIKKLGDKQ
ncbi:MAG: GNAT family N-acetyltransferase [Candidatus Schekmanbacteria bacterium]|nr:GNAT family N-acetyltransferase [Candidatus Schekmanbacteria bacterium]